MSQQLAVLMGMLIVVNSAISLTSFVNLRLQTELNLNRGYLPGDICLCLHALIDLDTICQDLFNFTLVTR